MTCFHPLLAAHQPGKTQVKILGAARSFDIVKAQSHGQFTIPCGNCKGCRISRAKEWAVRCVHEAQMHKHNSFITLTYNEQHLPQFGSLKPKDFQDFMKRLRKNTGAKIRYYMCGEYGEKFARPHYHACLFGYNFPDKRFHQEINGEELHTSDILDQAWSIDNQEIGFSTIGEVTWQSAAYVARYIMKKINGKNAQDHYQVPDAADILREVTPEYATMSRGGQSKTNNKGGIGKDWYNKYRDTDVFPDDFITITGKKYKTPRYYSQLYEIEDPEQYAIIKAKRIALAARHAKDQTPERLEAIEKVQERKSSLLIRQYEAQS